MLKRNSFKVDLEKYFKSWQNILTLILLILLVGLGVFLRIRNLGYLSFWGDDGHTFIGTVSILGHGYPLLPSGYVLYHGILDYYLNVIPVLIFGANEFAFRITSVFFGVSTIILIYFVGKTIANKFVGFLSAFLITFSTWYVQFSREARYFAVLQFFFLLSFYFFYKGFINNQKPFRVLAAIFMVLTPLVHGNGFFLILLFIPLLLYLRKGFFTKKIVIPLVMIIFLDGLQIVNQVFFWKVGRSFYTVEKDFISIIRAYFKVPDPYYFKIIEMMFPKMFALFLVGILVMIGFIVFMSIRRDFSNEKLFLNENELKWGRVKVPFNIVILYLIFVITVAIISMGQMYHQQRYIYFIMPFFVLIFSYIVYLISVSIARFIYLGIKKVSGKNLNPKVLIITITLIFILLSVFTVSGINPKEVLAIPYIKHSDRLNSFYSVSTAFSYHWDMATPGKYVYEHMRKDDIVITTDIYNTYPYTRKIDYWLWTGYLESWSPFHSVGYRVYDDTYGVMVIRNLVELVEVFNENYDKNIWIITSHSLFTPEHISPEIKEFLDNKPGNLVITGRDNTSRLYYFPGVNIPHRLSIKDIISPSEDNILDFKGREYTEVDFTESLFSKYLIYGWGEIEKDIGCWGIGRVSLLYISGGNGQKYELNIMAKPIVRPDMNQGIEILLNDNKIGTFSFSKDYDFRQYSLEFGEDLLKKDVNILKFKYKYSISPKELGISEDARRLSVLFKNLIIKKVD